jgi:Methyltransferase domain
MGHIDYQHSADLGGIASAEAALTAVSPFASMLDVGCGGGPWMRAAMMRGVEDVRGVEGIIVHDEARHVPRDLIDIRDLTQPLNLGRKFELVVCLEVAEHLDARHASTLVKSLAAHGDYVLFSAACPGQAGTHHVNCQWPSYWQGMFNANGFACYDTIRWRLWNTKIIYPWYRQNLFEAHRSTEAGREPRIPAVVHPDMLTSLSLATQREAVEAGELPAVWYLTGPAKGLTVKLLRRTRLAFR